MALTFTQSDWAELWKSTAQPQTVQTAIDNFETIEQFPSCIGSGYSRSLELATGIYLDLSDYTCHQDWIVKVPVHNHLIQIFVLLSGAIDCEGVHPTLGGSRAYFSGSGLSPSYDESHYRGQRMTMVNVEIEPELLEPLFGEDEQSGQNLRSLLCKGQDWKAAFYPTATVAMRSLAQQLWNAPYHGVARQIYLQAKIWELLAMQIDLVMSDRFAAVATPKLRPDTIARLHHAKEILTKHYEHPPLLSDLAKQVGVSDRTLRRGFQELFDISPLAYLTQQRIHQARNFLQQGQWTITEVARMVGYGHLGHFATAFKQEFGVTPSRCMSSRKL